MRNSRKVSIVRVNLTQEQSKSQGKSHLGEVILHFLTIKKMKPADLARKTGVSPATVSNWINGGHSFKIDNLEKILKALEINFLEFAMIANEFTSWGKFNPASKK